MNIAKKGSSKESQHSLMKAFGLVVTKGFVLVCASVARENGSSVSEMNGSHSRPLSLGCTVSLSNQLGYQDL